MTRLEKVIEKIKTLQSLFSTYNSSDLKERLNILELKIYSKGFSPMTSQLKDLEKSLDALLIDFKDNKLNSLKRKYNSEELPDLDVFQKFEKVIENIADPKLLKMILEKLEKLLVIKNHEQFQIQIEQLEKIIKFNNLEMYKAMLKITEREYDEKFLVANSEEEISTIWENYEKNKTYLLEKINYYKAKEIKFDELASEVKSVPDSNKLKYKLRRLMNKPISNFMLNSTTENFTSDIGLKIRRKISSPIRPLVKSMVDGSITLETFTGITDSFSIEQKKNWFVVLSSAKNESEFAQMFIEMCDELCLNPNVLNDYLDVSLEKYWYRYLNDKPNSTFADFMFLYNKLCEGVLIKGYPKLSENESYLFLSTHNFPEETNATLAEIDRNAYIVFGTTDQIKHFYKMYAVWLNGAYYLDRFDRESRKAALDKEKRILLSGTSILKYCEGNLNNSENLLVGTIFPGFMKVIRETGRKIVPISTFRDHGSKENCIAFGNPIDLTIYDDEEAKRILRDYQSSMVLKQIEKHSEKINRDELGENPRDNYLELIRRKYLSGACWSKPIFKEENSPYISDSILSLENIYGNTKVITKGDMKTQDISIIEKLTQHVLEHPGARNNIHIIDLLRDLYSRASDLEKYDVVKYMNENFDKPLTWNEPNYWQKTTDYKLEKKMK